ncbi:MAG: hypothetical protein JXA07_06330 [Spirochaetes bacterium]|nr:hypothetical protein [Spirochaetota bacterium]
MIKRIKIVLIITLLIAAGTISCDMDYDKEEIPTDAIMMGGGCLSTMPIVMRSTTYDMGDQVIAMSEQVIMNMTVQNSQPNMTSMYEMYGGVQLELDFTGFNILTFVAQYISNPDSAMDSMMAYVKQTPLLTQFWALQKMSSTVNAGSDGEWMTNDDTIDPLYGYFVTEKMEDGTYRQISYSDFGVTPVTRTDYIVENNLKTKTYTYEAGGDGEFETEDDVLVKTTCYTYNAAGKMESAVNYSDDETTFENIYVFNYDENGILQSMYSYEDEAATNRMAWGSYSNLTWGETNGIKTLDIVLGLRLDVLFEFDTALMHFHYEFNDDGTIHKMIMYEPLSGSSIDTCYVYVYSGSGMLSMGKMNDESLNYSDDEATQVSRTVNELILGGM